MIVFILLILSPCVLRGQDDASKNVRATNFLNRLSQFPNLRAGDVLRTLPSSEVSEVVGDPYWDKDWAISSLQLYKNDQMAEGYLTRYNIYSKEVEFKIRDDVKILPGEKVKNLVWIDSITNRSRFLVNAAAYRVNGVPLLGFLEVLVEGESSLFKRIYLEVLKPDFNPALNVGSKDTRILKKEEFFYNTGAELSKIKSRRDVARIFDKFSVHMDSFVKEKNIKFNNENDLIKVFIYFSSLNTQK